MGSVPQLKTGSDYQNLAFIRFWDSYARYHPTDMLEIAIAIINSLEDKGTQGTHKKKYLKELSQYYISMSDALKHWYIRMKFKSLSCPFDMGCLELINIVRYSRRPVIVDEVSEEKYSKHEVETYFKHMKAHILDIMVKTSAFFVFDITDLSKSSTVNLPPEIIKR